MTHLSMPAFAPPRDPATAAIRVGDVLSGSRKAFAAHGLAYCAIMALGYAPIALVTAGSLADDSGDASSIPDDVDGLTILIGVAVIAVLLACLSLAPAAIAFGVAQDVSGRGFSFNQAMRAALRRSPAILALTVIVVIGGMLGIILLVVPGLIFFCVYAVAVPACVVEGLGPIDSMSRSAFLTRGDRWRVFEILCLVYLGGIGLGQLVSFIATRITNDMVGFAISLPLEIFVGAFSAVALGVLYVQLRVAREGVDIEPIAKVFD